MRNSQKQFSPIRAVPLTRRRRKKQRFYISVGLISLGLELTASATVGLGLGFSCPTTPAYWGDMIEITGTLTNTGSTAVTNIIVPDESAISYGVVITTIPSLDRHQEITFSGNYVVAPSNRCNINHNLNASGTSTHGDAVSSTAFAYCPSLPRTGLKFTVDCPSNTPAPGELFSISGSITNVGTAPVTSMILDVYQSGSVVLHTSVIGFLYPGQGEEFNQSYLISTNLSPSLEITNTFVLVGATDCGLAVSNIVAQICSLTAPTLTNGPQLSVLSTPEGIALSWPAQTAGFTVQKNSDLSTTNWLGLTNTPAVLGDRNQVVLPRTESSGFYRLKSK